MTSSIVRFKKIGGPDEMQIEEFDVPAPGQSEVRVLVKALGVNRAESIFRAGQYQYQPILPARLGYEAAGTIESIGSGVEGLAGGEAVSTAPAFSQNQYGMYGELALVPARAVMKHPSSLSWEQAA